MKKKFSNQNINSDLIKPSEYKSRIFNISILSEENKQQYSGTNSLTDQEKVLYYHIDSFKKEAIKRNIGFYISIILVYTVLNMII